MASSLLELTASIVSSHASVTEMSGEDLLLELQKVHGALQKLEVETGEGVERGEGKGPAVPLKKAFQPDQVSCMLCGKSGMKTLARHLAQVHGIKPGEYRKQFGIPSNQALTAKNFSEARRRMAQEKGLADNLAKARAVRAAKLAAKGGAEKKPAKTPRAPKQKQQMSA
ncbi:MucR family transcriptional regulator [Geomonas sp. Red69]|uniref:MucR family transcriptional regulator n=1 Tax=Geomonas diazotrophica TaxID=2843197 RepID=A0ABX8JLM0_9BACT|nr:MULTISPECIES: MucR family transcriptional regulator [Geomonas]MBU5636616.1 MucR family transcriptional regulator [Geomonas diazotrophica]QWV98564.1 MucR family transcriptional regulator [Geomonas nitrogeniifigens]QXE87747.1 MucR family transcriptional regulator [Geomonas nitrogeniifigens]